MMIRSLICSLCLLMVPGLALAQTQSQTSAQAPAAGKAAPSAAAQAHRDEDIAKHRQMARAHEEAAQCLAAGTPEKKCQERLREACKGIAVGQYCGMRHAH
jgi:predicted kinase